MKVSDAMAARKSIRAFLDRPVSDELIRDVLRTASRAPSGGNVQPWRIYVLNGDAQARFKTLMLEKMQENPQGEPPEYDVYPAKLKEPYRTARFNVGEAMYGLLDIPRDDKASRLMWFANNYQFFGAPASIFYYMDRCMGPPQWSDAGMFLQSAMLLFQEAGVDTCAQEAWCRWHKTVSEFVGAPEELTLFCGLAIGYKDPESPVNDLVTDRIPVEEFATFVS